MVASAASVSLRTGPIACAVPDRSMKKVSSPTDPSKRLNEATRQKKTSIGNGRRKRGSFRHGKPYRGQG